MIRCCGVIGKRAPETEPFFISCSAQARIQFLRPLRRGLPSATEPPSRFWDRRSDGGDGPQRPGGRIGAVDLAAVEQLLDLVAGQRLVFEQRLGEEVELVLVALENFGRLGVRAPSTSARISASIALLVSSEFIVRWLPP